MLSLLHTRHKMIDKFIESCCCKFILKKKLLIIVTVIFTSINSYAQAEMFTTAELMLLGRDQIERTDGFQSITTIMISLSAPIEKEIVIPIKYGGTAVLNKDYTAGNLYSETVTKAVFPSNETEVFIHISAQKITNRTGIMKVIEIELDQAMSNVPCSKSKIHILVR